MRTFLSVWIGQFLSMLGSKLSEFALAIWAYQQISSSTQSTTQVAFLVVLMYLPTIIMAPLAGSLVDRWNRRWAMILSDLVAAGCSLVALLLSWSGHLQLWHIYMGVPILAVFSAFQAPAYSAAIAQLVPKQHRGRANGLADLPQGVAAIVTPMLAAWLTGVIKLNGILLIDCLTFIPALMILLSVRFPSLPHKTDANLTNSRRFGTLLQESKSSWRYIRTRKSLLKLWIFIILTYFTIGMFDISFWLLVIKFGSATKFGVVISAAGCGMLAGSTVMSTWGGPKRRILGILNLTILQGFVILILGLGVRLSLFIASIGVFIYQFADPIIMGSNRTIWQSKVPLELQGRIFALQIMLQRAALIPAFIITGVLVDRLFEPLLLKNQWIRDTLGQLTGTQPGIGICLFLIILGISKMLLSILMYQDSLLLRVESCSAEDIINRSPIPDGQS
jgi:MFS transporter, DHA3 family, macrolide efflux protein